MAPASIAGAVSLLGLRLGPAAVSIPILSIGLATADVTISANIGLAVVSAFVPALFVTILFGGGLGALRCVPVFVDPRDVHSALS